MLNEKKVTQNLNHLNLFLIVLADVSPAAIIIPPNIDSLSVDFSCHTDCVNVIHLDFSH